MSDQEGRMLRVTSLELDLPDDYPRLLAELKTTIRTSQAHAHRTVNTQLIELYWSIGTAILNRQHAEGWGAKVIDRLAADLSEAFPDSKGFSRRNLQYMRDLATAWSDGPNVPQAVAHLPWGHVRLLLDKLKTPAERDWYVQAAVANGWTRNNLLNQIMARSHERTGSAPSNFGLTLSPDDSELAAQLAKDPYVFDFLGLTGRVAERDLEDALVSRLQSTLLELGTGFAFVGRQVRITVDGDEFILDLLFFNIPQVRYVVVELKIGKFEPEFIGKLGFYIALVDDRWRDPALHAPTVGILLCAGRNDTVVRYSLGGATQPMAVAGYTYDKLPAVEQAALPSDVRVAAALESPMEIGGQQLTLADYLDSIGAEPWTPPEP